jgi:cell division protein FtsQ
MRSVKPERKTRGPVRAARAVPVRGKRDLPKVQPGTSRGGRKEGGQLTGLIKRPIVTLCAIVLTLVLIGALLASGVIGRAVRGVGHGVNMLVADAGFGISEIHITGNRRTPYNSVLEALAMKPGESIFHADLWSAQDRLRHLDWIASAELHRRYPDAIFVTLVEKRPFALWQLPPNAKGETPIAVVERSGAVITTRDVEKFRHLPKLVGAGAAANAAELVDAVQAHRAIAARIAAYSYQSQRRWNLLLDDGVTVQLPEAGWQKELDALEHLIIDTGVLERDISEIDLRSPTHYFFILKSGEKKDVERGKET